MTNFVALHHREQEQVNTFFQAQSSYWKEVYNSSDVEGNVYRERQAAVLHWIDGLGLMPGSRVLEIGCGAGFLSVALAQRGLRVQAIDPVEAMVEQARRHALESETDQLLSVDLGDISSLSFEDASFDLVVAIGVIPWLQRPDLAIQEVARVTRKGGHVVLTSDNRAGLIILLDPWYNPAFRPLRSLAKDVLARLRRRLPSSGTPDANFYSCCFIDEILASVGLVNTNCKTLGFGPLTFFYRRVLPDVPGLLLHRRLQSHADRGMPVLRSMGVHYLVLARKSDSLLLEQSTEVPEKAVSSIPGQYQPSRGPLTEGSRAPIGFRGGVMHDEQEVHGFNTSESVATHHREQEQVNVYFQSQSSYWKEVYSSSDVFGNVYRERQAAVLHWINGLGLVPGSRVLEIGCGAGFLSVELARCGLRVQAIDPVEAMVELARRHAIESETDQLLSVDPGDISALAFEDASFDLVVAIGVMAYLKRPDLAIQEMARVARPGGHIVLTAANPVGLTMLLDPWYNPVFRPLRLLVKDLPERLGLRPWSPRKAFHSRRFIDEALASAELVKVCGKTLGFGPFLFLQHRLLPDVPGLLLHRRLQSLADRGVPVLRSMGVSYLVLSRKPMSNFNS